MSSQLYKADKFTTGKFHIGLLKSISAILITQNNWYSKNILSLLVTFINIYRHNVKQRVAPSTRTATPVIESWLPALEWPGRLRRRTVEPSAPTTAQHMYVQQTKKIKNNTNNSSFKRLCCKSHYCYSISHKLLNRINWELARSSHTR